MGTISLGWDLAYRQPGSMLAQCKLQVSAFPANRGALCLQWGSWHNWCLLLLPTPAFRVQGKGRARCLPGPTTRRSPPLAP
ncbi:hypothetical protein DUNSADRAFT_10063 [Dunaliella salina]|uniref:Uncharacterized protein n=1 Tax=Dunaliella salina TaxID=3046 RepID=A0ABQ7GG46_DUNSA|nr:hypothetical protein DUNSADRAFT_10063 [Dunaliella salina]|eukprot:KAF5833573.1 hypothetical protein DUNSADRAFT_10063 [Dunaliella salina]